VTGVAVPPLRIRWNLWRDVRLLGRSREITERWQPFSATAAVLAVLGLVFNAAALFGMLVASGFWLAADRGRVLSGEFLCGLPGSGDRAACLALFDRENITGSLTVIGWLTTVFFLVLAPIAGLNIFVQVTWYLRSAVQRSAAWQESLYWEYAGTGPATAKVMAPPGRHELVIVGNIDWIRRVTGLLGRHRSGFGQDRLIHARRWAMARETQSLAGALAGLGGLSVALGLVLWQYGYIPASRQVTLSEAAGALVADYAWSLVHAVPALEITDTLQWKRPELFAGARGWAIILLVLKILLFLPVVSYLADIIRGRRDPQVPVAPYESDPVIQALFGRILDSAIPVYYFTRGKGWPDLYTEVATDLTAAGHADPAGNAWTPATVASHVITTLAESRQNRSGQAGNPLA
jgi:hypothetical protein